MSADAALEVADLSYAYGPRQVLNNVGFSVPVGQFAV